MVTQKNAERRYPRVRVANFTGAAISGHAVISLAGSPEPDPVAEIRRHADLPYVFVISESQSAVIARVLGRLKAIRSPCYPHALFVLGKGVCFPDDPDVEIMACAPDNPLAIGAGIDRYARSKFIFDKTRLNSNNRAPLPAHVDVIVVGAGITGLYAAIKLKQKQLSFCVVEKLDTVGGIWSKYANLTSLVNTSEAAYRLREQPTRANRDHSSTAEILEDIHHLAEQVSGQLFTRACVDKIEKHKGGYRATITRNGETESVTGTGVILAINDRVGTPRTVTWQNQDLFQGELVNGHSDEAFSVDWRGKNVVVVGMGAFAAENARTALEAGVSHVTVVCRRHGTICPKIIDYLNFSTAYNERFEHDRKSNIRNMMLWKKLYDLSGATQPECWMAKIKHEGHTISVSDIWFIAHHLKRMATVTGSVTGMFEHGVIVGDQRIEADIVVNCVGFHRNGSAAKAICGYAEIYNNNYIDKDFMYIADAYIDDNAFNSFFGSSVLEMTKFYLDVYFDFFDNPAFDEMMQAEGVEKIAIDDRRWSKYIAGAEALIRAFPRYHGIAKAQIDKRTANFMETHDLETYIAANKREWIDTHRLLAGMELAQEDYLPFVFDKLIEKKNGPGG